MADRLSPAKTESQAQSNHSDTARADEPRSNCRFPWPRETENTNDEQTIRSSPAFIIGLFTLFANDTSLTFAFHHLQGQARRILTRGIHASRLFVVGAHST